MKKQLKRLVVLAVATAMLASSALSVSAAGLRDVFDAKHYADTYKDLKAAFGDNEELLYQHFINYGLKENRQMSPIIDVQAYRKAYPDLEAAFGNNWDAYVEHFFMFGAKENRTGGVLFNPFKYAEAYPDVKAAFGSNLKAITKHFLLFGIKEGRTAGVVAKAPASSGGGSSSGGSSGGGGGSQTTPPVVTPATAPTPLTAPATTVPTNSDANATLDSNNKVATVAVTTANIVSSYDTVISNTSNSGKIIDLVINASKATGTVEEAKVQLPVAVMTALKGKKNAAATNGNAVLAVTVESALGDVTIPLAALEKAQNGSDVAVDIVVKKATVAPAVLGEVPAGNRVIVDVALEVNGRPATNITGLDATPIQISMKTSITSAPVYVYYVNKDGVLTLEGVTTSDGSGNVKFKVKHLTEFVFATAGHSKTSAQHVKKDFTAFTNEGKCALCAVTYPNWQDNHGAHAWVADGLNSKCSVCEKVCTHTKDSFTESGKCPTCKMTKNDFIAACAKTDAHKVVKIDVACGTCGVNGPALYDAAGCPDKSNADHGVGTACPKCGYTKPAGGDATTTHQDGQPATHVAGDFTANEPTAPCTNTNKTNCSVTKSEWCKADNGHSWNSTNKDTCDTCDFKCGHTLTDFSDPDKCANTTSGGCDMSKIDFQTACNHSAVTLTGGLDALWHEDKCPTCEKAGGAQSCSNAGQDGGGTGTAHASAGENDPCGVCGYKGSSYTYSN